MLQSTKIFPILLETLITGFLFLLPRYMGLFFFQNTLITRDYIFKKILWKTHGCIALKSMIIVTFLIARLPVLLFLLNYKHLNFSFTPKNTPYCEYLFSERLAYYSSKIYICSLLKNNKIMSATWYECKIKYRKMDESGVQKMTTEPYLVDAVSYTEAESRINEEMTAYISDEFKITNIKVANFAEIHPFENSDRWFKSKVALIAYDEESGKERKSNMYLLVQANDVKEAFDNTNKMMHGTLGDYTIPTITESPIMDVFPYFSGEEDDLEKLEEFNALKAAIPTKEEKKERLVEVTKSATPLVVMNQEEEEEEEEEEE